MQKSQINLKIRNDILEKLDEKSEEEYRTRSNMIEKILNDYLGKRNYWLWVAREGGIEDNLETGVEMSWEGCDPETAKGDKALIYLTSPQKHIRYLVEILEDPIQDDAIMTKKGEKMGFRCRFRILYIFEKPLTIKEMRNSPNLSKWYPLKVCFIRMVFDIEEKYWGILGELLIKDNPDVKDKIE